MSSKHLWLLAISLLSYFHTGVTFNLGKIMALSNTPFNKKYPLSKNTDYWKKKVTSDNNPTSTSSMIRDRRFNRKFPLSKNYYEEQLLRLKSSNSTIRDMEILGKGDPRQHQNSNDEYDDGLPDFEKILNKTNPI